MPAHKVEPYRRAGRYKGFRRECFSYRVSYSIRSRREFPIMEFPTNFFTKEIPVWTEKLNWQA